MRCDCGGVRLMRCGCGSVRLVRCCCGGVSLRCSCCARLRYGSRRSESCGARLRRRGRGSCKGCCGCGGSRVGGWQRRRGRGHTGQGSGGRRRGRSQSGNCMGEGDRGNYMKGRLYILPELKLFGKGGRMRMRRFPFPYDKCNMILGYMLGILGK